MIENFFITYWYKLLPYSSLKFLFLDKYKIVLDNFLESISFGLSNSNVFGLTTKFGNGGRPLLYLWFIFFVGLIKTPLWWSETTSGIPSTFVAITGILQNPASILTIPRGSLMDGTTKISNFLIKSKGFITFPTNLTLLLFR